MHFIQSHVLQVLTYQRYARFSEMKPTRVDSNVYSYHLKSLQKDGFVHKTDQGYTLSAKGLSYVDALSADHRKARKQPKAIAIFGLQNAKGEWLVVQRLTQPYIEQFMLPSGKQHFGESPEQHIQRELREQLGVVPEVRRCGYADVRINKDGEVITHICGHVYTGIFNGPLPDNNKKFRYVFLDKGHDNLVARTTDLIEAIESSNQPFFRSFDAEAGE